MDPAGQATPEPTGRRKRSGEVRMAHISTDSSTARYLMKGQFSFLEANGFKVHVLASPGEDLAQVEVQEGVSSIGIPMSREISPLRDLVSLVRLVRVLRALSPVIVNSGTPKAGLLGTLAARIAGVPIRVYTLRGLRLETAGGWRRRALAAAERVAAMAATSIVAVSESLKARYVGLGLAPAEKVTTLAHGSSNGVDLSRFKPISQDRDRLAGLRARLGIPPRARVIGFVGRLVRDKGIVDLHRAFLSEVLPAEPRAHLLLLGRTERGDALLPGLLQELVRHPQISQIEFVEDVAPYYHLFEVLAFPSYREGYPNAPLEAAASGVPVVGYAATGTVDAVSDTKTGRLVPVGDWRALGAALRRYLQDEELRRADGARARLRAESLFSQELVWSAWVAHYRRLLRELPQRAGAVIDAK